MDPDAVICEFYYEMEQVDVPHVDEQDRPSSVMV